VCVVVLEVSVCSGSGGRHLQEVLAGADEGQLSTGAVGLRLAASDPLDQLRDLLRHHLMPHTHTHTHTLSMLSSGGNQRQRVSRCLG